MKITIKNNPVTIRIEGGGGEPPTPQPAPVTVYDNWRPVISNVLTGFVTDDWEEVTNNGD